MIEQNPIAVGERLRSLRGGRDIKTVAASVKISANALKMYEQGNRVPRDEVKERLSAYYGIKIEDIFGC